MLNISQWLNSSSKDGTTCPALSIHPLKSLSCFSFVGRNLSILLTLTTMRFTCLSQSMDAAESYFYFRFVCFFKCRKNMKFLIDWIPSCYKGMLLSRNVENTIMLTSSVFKRLSICINKNCLSYSIILNGFWSNACFHFFFDFL